MLLIPPPLPPPLIACLPILVAPNASTPSMEHVSTATTAMGAPFCTLPLLTSDVAVALVARMMENDTSMTTNGMAATAYLVRILYSEKFLQARLMKDVRDTNEATKLQMEAVGPQDAHIRLNPEMSFFDRHVDTYGAFAVTPMPVEFPVFEFDVRNRVIIPRSGDVLRAMYVEISLPRGVRTTGYRQNKSFLKRARLVVDDSLVQDLEGLWLDVLEKVVFDRRRRLMARPVNTVHVPLRFVKDVPMYAMFGSTVYVDLEIAFPAWLAALRVRPSDVHVRLLCDFVTLDGPERAVMLNTEHQIMYARPLDVEALSYATHAEGRTPKKSVRLDLSEINVPTVFVAVVAYKEGDSTFTYLDCIESIDFQVDGQELFEPRPADYFALPQLYQHSPTSCPPDSNVHVYSFGLKLNVFGEDGVGAGSTGHLNLAGIRSPSIVVRLADPLSTDVVVKAFAGTINWLRVANGFAAPMFA